MSDLREYVARVPGPHSYDDLRALASGNGITAALRSGDLVRLLSGAFAWRAYAEAWPVLASAALDWAGPRAALDGSSALWVCGAGDCPAGVELVLPHGDHLRPPTWLRVRTATYSIPVALDEEARRVVTASHGLIRAFSVADPRVRSEIVYRAFRARVVAPGEVLDALAGTPRVRGRKRLACIVESAALGHESYLEERATATVLTGAEFAELARQYRVVTPDGRFRLDAFDAATLTAFELDGREAHEDARARLRDVRRDAALAAIGIVTVRFTYTDVMTRPQWCRAIAVETMRSRATGFLAGALKRLDGRLVSPQEDGEGSQAEGFEREAWAA